MPQFVSDQTGMSRAERRKAREKMRKAAQVDHGKRGQHPNSRAALAANTPRSPVTLGPRCKGIAKHSGKPCGQPAVRGADFCCYHGGREQAPTSSAARRWYRKTGQRLDDIGRTKNALRKQLQGVTPEERQTVGERMPRRVAGGPVAFLQLLVMGINALRAFRDQTDPLAWQRFTRHAAGQAFKPKHPSGERFDKDRNAKGRE